jgi:phage terminase small subunit
MKPGKKKQPESVAKAKGTYRGDRYEVEQRKLPEGNFINEDSYPNEVPELLQQHGVRLWKQVILQARERGNWIAWDDLPGLTIMCGAWDVVCQVTGQPYLDIDDKGNKRVSVEWKVYKDSVMLFERWADRFGLDPSSKSKFDFTKKADEPEDFTDLEI